ncbi:methylmalonyl-CoA epimerase [Bacillus fonticola]|uniref:methylmalonyl-CoA epimerase n=1 Tax=Bacillus fonticola TaxID=2728853 RepID=UPI001473E115|nr:methylmalonyl-CoA epimerase [Bacillus fonticola]
MEKAMDHIGIAVHSIESALPFYRDMLGLPLLATETVDSQNVKVAFLQAGNVKLELLEPVRDTSPIAQFLKKRGEGIHHVALRVSSLSERLQELKEKGVQLIDEQPKPGAGGANVAFLHPKQANKVLIELCEKGCNR